MPPYSWNCHACEKANSPSSEICQYCGCPALASAVQVEFHKTGVIIDPLMEIKTIGRFLLKVFVPLFVVFLVSIISAVIAVYVAEMRCGPASEPGDSGVGGAALGMFVGILVVIPTLIYCLVVEIIAAVKTVPYRLHIALLFLPLIAAALLMKVVPLC